MNKGFTSVVELLLGVYQATGPVSSTKVEREQMVKKKHIHSISSQSLNKNWGHFCVTEMMRSPVPRKTRKELESTSWEGAWSGDSLADHSTKARNTQETPCNTHGGRTQLRWCRLCPPNHYVRDPQSSGQGLPQKRTTSMQILSSLS